MRGWAHVVGRGRAWGERLAGSRPSPASSSPARHKYNNALRYHRQLTVPACSATLSDFHSFCSCLSCPSIPRLFPYLPLLRSLPACSDCCVVRLARACLCPYHIISGHIDKRDSTPGCRHCIHQEWPVTSIAIGSCDTSERHLYCILKKSVDCGAKAIIWVKYSVG